MNNEREIMNTTEMIEKFELSVGDAHTLRFMEAKVTEAQTQQEKGWAEDDLREFMLTLCYRNIDKMEWSTEA
jgi:hypothetical protein